METLLRSLDCPFGPPSDLASARTLVEWLEDRKVRCLDELERTGLRAGPSDEAWLTSFASYLAGLGCPFSPHPDLMTSIGWLVGFAISLEHEDLTQREPTEGTGVGDEVDIRSRVDEICRRLRLSRLEGEEDFSLLDRAARLIRFVLKEESLEALDHATESEESRHALALEEFPLGFQVGDRVVNDVAVVLRMLYLDDLRELQHDLNALIALGQEHTANP